MRAVPRLARCFTQGPLFDTSTHEGHTVPEHSPAPWTIHRASEFTGDAADTAIMSIRAANEQTVVYTDSGYFKPKEADAALIAAAPEMLQALRAIRAFLTDEYVTAALYQRGQHGRCEGCYRAATDAITKATVKA